MRKSLFLLVGVFGLVFFAGSISRETQLKGIKADAPKPATLKVNTDYGRMALYFIPNHGQMDKQVAYYIQGKDKTLYFTNEGITFALTKPVDIAEVSSKADLRRSRQQIKGQDLDSRKIGFNQSAASAAERWVVKLEFVGAEKGVKPVGETLGYLI